jgi:hypothetical protein
MLIKLRWIACWTLCKIRLSYSCCNNKNLFRKISKRVNIGNAPHCCVFGMEMVVQAKQSQPWTLDSYTSGKQTIGRMNVWCKCKQVTTYRIIGLIEDHRTACNLRNVSTKRCKRQILPHTKPVNCPYYVIFFWFLPFTFLKRVLWFSNIDVVRWFKFSPQN